MLHNSPLLSSALHLCSLLYITTCTTALTAQVDSNSINTSDRRTDNTVTVVCGHDAAQEMQKHCGMYNYTRALIIFHDCVCSSAVFRRFFKDGAKLAK